MGPKVAPLGEWQSPITTELIVSKTLGLSSPSLLEDGSVVWVELRPSEGGRQVLVQRLPDGSVQDVTPPVDSGINVRTTVHEYGGGQYLAHTGEVYFSNFKDQRLWRQALTPQPSPPEPLTAADSGLRFADALLDARRSRLIAVVEDHSTPGAEAANSLSAVALDDGAVTVLASGADFYHSPALSPDGGRLAWVQWNHPNMPWDDTELWVADVGADGALVGGRRVAGGSGESVQQPRWASDGSLLFVSDASNWWNLWKEVTPGQLEALLPMETEFGSPAWQFGLHSFDEIPGSGGLILATYSDPTAAGSALGVVDPAAKTLTRLETGFSSFSRICIGVVGSKLSVAVVAGSASKASALVVLQVDGVAGLLDSTPDDWLLVQASSELQLDPGYLSQPRSLQFPTEGGLTSYMNFYPPQNKDYEFPPGELPALLVKIHGGPTSAASTTLNLGIQFWSSRGFAVADVNYGGSTGFGRDYRNRLRGNWGVVDVDDCCNAARFLAEQGLVDPKRMCITGGSAGGYTTLAALAFRDVFAAGASHYGVADAELLAQHTHKFESRYLDLLMGPYPAAQELYRQRSPIHSANDINAPIILFQGDEDKVVPPEQSELLYSAVKAKGLPTALVMYKGEQHGFRSAAAIRSALEGELWFYSQVLGFNGSYPPELQPITIDNHPPPAA